MAIVVSGIRPTGNMHLGNYFGAVRNFLKMQDESGNTCFFFIADLHALTTHPDPADFHQRTRQTLAQYLACGVKPDKCTLYVQSDVPEIAELYLLFNMMAYKGELEKVASFKDKVRKHEANINAGLLTYPVLMAADILVHRATHVPVGKDQEQHLEMTRNFAKRFNHLTGGELFPEPVAYNFGRELVKVPGLDGNGKMGKSEGPNNAVFLTDDDDAIRKRVMKAVTDAGPKEPNSPIHETVQHIFSLMELVSAPVTLQQYQKAYADCSIRYGDMKKQLAEDMIRFIAPIRERILEISQDDSLLRKTAKTGAEKARASAAATLQEARKAMGIRSF